MAHDRLSIPEASPACSRACGSPWLRGSLACSGAIWEIVYFTGTDGLKHPENKICLRIFLIAINSIFLMKMNVMTKCAL